MKFLLYKGVFLGFIANFFVFLALGWVAYKRVMLKTELLERQQRKDQIELSLSRSLESITQAANMAKGFAFTNDSKYLERFNASTYDVENDLRDLLVLFKDNIQQKQNIEEYKRLVDQKIKYHAELVELIKYRDFDVAKKQFSIEKNLQLNDEFEIVTGKITEKEQQVYAEHEHRILKLDKILKNTFAVLFVLCVLLLCSVFFIIRHHLRGRIKAETLLEGNELIIKSIIDRTSEPIFMKEIDGEYILANKQFENLFLREPGTIKGKTDTDIFPKDVADRLREIDLEVIRTEKEMRSEEILPHNGEMRTYIMVKFPLWDLKNKIYGVGAIATDISEQKIIETRLKESEAIIQTLFDVAPEAVIMMDQDDRIIKWNNKSEELFQYSSEEAIGKFMHELIMPERYWENHVKGMQNYLKTGDWPILDRTIEISAINKNNKEFDIELSISSSLVKGKYIFVAFAKDISARKKLEHENQENKNFLTSVVDNIPDMIFVKDADELRFVTFNKAGEKLLGYPKKEMIGKNDFDFFPKQQAEFFASKDKQVLQNKELVDIKEEEVDTKNGKRWLHTKKIPIMDENGKPKYLLGISSDVTKRKHLEIERDEAAKKLRENEKRISLILENIGEGVIVSDHKKKVILLNQMAEEILELQNTATATDWSELYDIFYPDGRTVFPAQNLPIEKALRGEPTDEEEILIRNPETRQIKLLKVNGRPIFDDKGYVIAAVATIRDVTQYKEMERALEESEMKYRRLIGFQRDGNSDKKSEEKKQEEKKVEEKKPEEKKSDEKKE